jgi:hypothetical protein
VQHQVRRGRDLSSGSCPAWARLKVGDDRYGPLVGDRERGGGGVGCGWAGRVWGGGPLRCSKVTGERNEGGPADFRGWAWLGPSRAVWLAGPRRT